MNQITSILLLITFTTSSFANMCDINFKPGVDPVYKEDFGLAGRINFYESSIAVVKRLKRRRTYLEVNEVKSTYKRWFTNFKEVESHIFKETTDLAIYRLRKPYRNVSTSTASIKYYDDVMAYIRTNDEKLSESILDSLNLPKNIKDDLLSVAYKKDSKDLIEYIYKKQRTEYRRLGSFFDEYKYYESGLDNLSSSFECKKNCQDTILKLKRELGLTKKLNTVEAIFKSSPHSIVVARKKEFLNETFGFVRNIVSKIDITKSIFEGLKTKGIFQKSSLVKLFKTAYDNKARNLHRSIIDKMSLANLTKKQRADLLKKELITYTDESLVVNFARAEDYYPKKAWNEIKDYAAKSKDLEFYKLITDSELIAEKLGSVGSFSTTTFIKRAALIAASGAIVIYLLGSSDTSIRENGYDIVPSEDNSDINDIQTDDEGYEVIKLKYGSKDENSLYQFMNKVVDDINQALE